MAQTIKEKIKSLNLEERSVFDEIAIDVTDNLTPQLIIKFLDLKLIEQLDNGKFGMPYGVHIDWCSLCSEEIENE